MVKLYMQETFFSIAIIKSLSLINAHYKTLNLF